MYQGQAALLGAEVIKFCSVMQVEKQLLIILPLVLACLRNTAWQLAWPLQNAQAGNALPQSAGGAEDTS